MLFAIFLSLISNVLLTDKTNDTKELTKIKEKNKKDTQSTSDINTSGGVTISSEDPNTRAVIIHGTKPSVVKESLQKDEYVKNKPLNTCDPIMPKNTSDPYVS
ncbi:hypothetical protein CDIK_1012 [Cucumispora dikerogammari]|nr:hypothetical protein CDIK_1012 [Cucumispora dikerogammari]